MTVRSASAIDLSVDVGPLRLRNPVLAASGTLGYGVEFSEFFDLTRLGGIVAKGLTRHPQRGNPAPRLVETASGMLNAIGLDNAGVDAFLAEKLPALRRFGTAIIANISGHTVDEYAEMAVLLAAAADLAAIEVNVSCPNIREGGIAFGASAERITEITRLVRQAAPRHPVLVKLSPNVTDIVAMAAAAQEGGAHAVCIANTWLGMAIDAERRRPALANVTGGLSGPAIKPLALRMVWQVHRALPELPIIGLGGIMSGVDAAEYLLAGATAVAVGTASLVDPSAAGRVIDGLERYCLRHGVRAARDLTGALEIT